MKLSAYGCWENTWQGRGHRQLLPGPSWPAGQGSGPHPAPPCLSHLSPLPTPQSPPSRTCRRPHLRPSPSGARVLPTHLSGGGLASEELVVERAVGWAKAGLQEDTAICDGLQGGGTLIGEAEPYEELKKPGGTMVRRSCAPLPGSLRRPWARAGLGCSQETAGAAKMAQSSWLPRQALPLSEPRFPHL